MDIFAASGGTAASLWAAIAGGAVVGLVVAWVFRRREKRRDPSTADLSFAERYRRGWAARRYGTRAWIGFALCGLVVGAAALAAVSGALGPVIAALAFLYAAVCLAQGWRRHTLQEEPR